MDITKIDQKTAVRQVCKPLFPVLNQFVRECYTDIGMFLKPTQYFDARQKSQRLQAFMTNLHLANEWKKRNPSHEWNVDGSGFFHLENTITGLKIVFHAVDPVTRSVPKAGNSFAAQAMYTQRPDAGEGKLVQNLFGAPDLSGVNLILACDYQKISGDVFMRLFKLLTPGSYGAAGKVDFSFPVRTNGRDEIFIPDPEEGIDLLGDLLVEEKHSMDIAS